MKTLVLTLLLLAAPLASARADAAADAEGWGPLPQLLGDPGSIEDYALFGNSEAVQAILPGRWQIVPWQVVEGIEPDLLLQQCEKRYFEIGPGANDAFAFAVTQHESKGDSFPMWEIRWTQGNAFVHTSNLEGTLAAYRLDVEQRGLQMAAQIFRRAATTWAYLPLSTDRLLLIGAESGEALVMLRCPTA